jgi:molybdopterin converting factor small subunit
MKVKLVAFGIAREILQNGHHVLETRDNPTIAEVKTILIEQFPEFAKLRSLRFAVNEDYQDDTFLISANDEVVIIPPVSGG